MFVGNMYYVAQLFGPIQPRPGVPRLLWMPELHRVYHQNANKTGIGKLSVDFREFANSNGYLRRTARVTGNARKRCALIVHCHRCRSKLTAWGLIDVSRVVTSSTPTWRKISIKKISGYSNAADLWQRSAALEYPPNLFINFSLHL